MNLPTKLTVSRMGLAGLFLLSMSLKWQYAATAGLAIFIVASITDWLDGYVARQYNLISDLGKLLDPLADKILVSAALVSLVERNIAPMWMAVLIICREFLITGLRQLAASRQVIMSADQAGKHKTVTQMVVIILSLSFLSLKELGFGHTEIVHFIELTLYPFYCLAVFFTVVSGVLYVVKHWDLLEN